MLTLYVAPYLPLTTAIFSSLTRLYRCTNCLSFIQSLAEVIETIMKIAMKMETPGIHPFSGSENMPVRIVKKAAIAKYRRILLSRASLILSLRGGI